MDFPSPFPNQFCAWLDAVGGGHRDRACGLEPGCKTDQFLAGRFLQTSEHLLLQPVRQCLDHQLSTDSDRRIGAEESGPFLAQSYGILIREACNLLANRFVGHDLGPGDAIAPLSFFRAIRTQFEPKPLFDSAGEKTSYAVLLPVRHLAELRNRRAFRLLQKADNALLF